MLPSDCHPNRTLKPHCGVTMPEHEGNGEHVSGRGTQESAAVVGLMSSHEQQQSVLNNNTSIIDDLDTRASDMLAQAQSGFSLGQSSSADVESFIPSEVASTAQSELLHQSPVSIQTAFAQCNMSQSLLESAVDPVENVLPNEETDNVQCKINQLSHDHFLTVQLFEIDSIPDEILLLCFSFLKLQDLCQCIAPVCQRWHRLAYDCSLWKRLDLSERHINGPKLRDLVQRIPHGSIRYLDMSGVDHLTNEEMDAVAQCLPELTHLDVGFVDGFNSTMLLSVLTACPKLQFLNVEGCRHANNEMMRTLAGFQGSVNLRRLNFSHCSLVDESLLLLVRRMPGVTHLNIDGIAWISESIVRQIAAAYKDSLESLELDGNELSDNAINSVSFCNHLRTLSLSFCERLTDNSLTFLRRLTKLKKLVLRKGPSFTSSHLLEFFSSPTVQHLSHLDLTECQQLDDRGVQAIAHRCGSSLKMLYLSWCWYVTDEGMQAIAEKCQHMVKMYLIGLHLLEGGWLLTALDTMPDLVYVSFEQCNEVSDIIIEDAVRAKPDLRILNYYGELFMHSGAL